MKNISSYIEHTILKSDATVEDIKKICYEAIDNNFKGVCVNPSYISLVSSLLESKKPIPIAVVGFPLGASVTDTKVFETKEAIASGAKEIDMVMNIGALKQKDYKTVFNDIFNVVKEADPCDVKVIIETALLNEKEKIAACVIAKIAGAKFVKTSTGLHKGATTEDIKLIKSLIGNDMLIKASGGINTYKDAEDMIKAGARRIGSSSSMKILKESNGEN